MISGAFREQLKKNVTVKVRNLGFLLELKLFGRSLLSIIGSYIMLASV